MSLVGLIDYKGNREAAMKRGRPANPVPPDRSYKGEKMTTPNSLLERLFEHFPFDSGLLTSTGKSLLEEREGLRIFEEMSRDPQVRSAMTLKRDAVVSCPWTVTPASDKEEDAEIARFVEWNLKELFGRKGLGLKAVAQSAFHYGRSVSEIVFEEVKVGEFAGNYRIAKLKPKNVGMINFLQDEFNNLLSVVVTPWLSGTRIRGREPIKVSPFKVVHYNWNSDLDNPYGNPDLASVYPWWWAKKNYYKYALVYGDKYACPIPEFNVEKKLSTDEQTQLENAGRNFHASSSFITPKGVTTTLHQSNGTGGVFYINAVNQLCNAEIARAILAQTLTTNENSKTGTFAQAEVHNETLAKVLGEVRDDIELRVVQRQIVQRLVDVNYGPRETYPVFAFEPFDAAFLTQVATAIETLCNVEDANNNRLLDLREPWIRQLLKLPARNEEDFPYRDEPLPIQVDPNKVPPGAGTAGATKPNPKP